MLVVLCMAVVLVILFWKIAEKSENDSVKRDNVTNTVDEEGTMSKEDDELPSLDEIIIKENTSDSEQIEIIDKNNQNVNNNGENGENAENAGNAENAENEDSFLEKGDNIQEIDEQPSKPGESEKPVQPENPQDSEKSDGPPNDGWTGYYKI